MHDQKRFDKLNGTNPFLTANQARKILHVTHGRLAALANINGLTVRQIPGDNRRYYLRSEIEALSAAAVRMGARA